MLISPRNINEMLFEFFEIVLEIVSEKKIEVGKNLIFLEKYFVVSMQDAK